MAVVFRKAFAHLLGPGPPTGRQGRGRSCSPCPPLSRLALGAGDEHLCPRVPPSSLFGGARGGWDVGGRERKGGIHLPLWQSEELGTPNRRPARGIPHPVNPAGPLRRGTLLPSSVSIICRLLSVQSEPLGPRRLSNADPVPDPSPPLLARVGFLAMQCSNVTTSAESTRTLLQRSKG